MPAPHLEPRAHSRATQQGMGCPWPPVGRRARWQTQWLCWQTPQAQMSSMTKVSQQASTPSSQGEEPSAPLGKLNNSQRPRQGLYGMKLQSVLQTDRLTRNTLFSTVRLQYKSATEVWPLPRSHFAFDLECSNLNCTNEAPNT